MNLIFLFLSLGTVKFRILQMCTGNYTIAMTWTVIVQMVEESTDIVSGKKTHNKTGKGVGH